MNAVTVSGKDPLPRAIHSGELSRPTDGRLVLLRRDDPCHHRAGGRVVMPGKSVQPITSHPWRLYRTYAVCSADGGKSGGGARRSAAATRHQPAHLRLARIGLVIPTWTVASTRRSGDRRTARRGTNARLPGHRRARVRHQRTVHSGGRPRWKRRRMPILSQDAGLPIRAVQPESGANRPKQGISAHRCPNVQSTPDSPCEPIREVAHLCTS